MRDDSMLGYDSYSVHAVVPSAPQHVL